ncbi:hypothetical protein [Actinomadura sp. 3N508]|uniref:hypothetical protein n=1 Tax=Actinomadura sp. 3N508 TaxID=3375153 RepID=UPI003789FD7C
MRENRSADPWSAFLAPSRRDGEAARSDTGEYRRAPGTQPGAAGERPDADDARRRVLAQLKAAQGPMSLEQIHHATRLGLLEVANAVDALRTRGLVSVEREIDEIVRLTEE